jgi:glycosyltransferase involved in cell wall biosynthesis
MGSEADTRQAEKRYALVTAAYNEEKFIGPLIESVIRQTIAPLRWVIVSDGSTDRTDEIVSDYATRHEYVRLVRITEEHPRNFMAQVHAINRGFTELRGVEFHFVGNLDSDITLDPDYFQLLLDRFESDPALGLGGGAICERVNGQFEPRKANSRWSVPHGVQLFRRQCFHDIGGAYTPLPYGGPDWYVEICARMRDWKVESFADLKVRHHRPTGGVEGGLRASYRMGLMDQSFGAHPVFELFKVARRVSSRPPFVLAPAVRLWAYCLANCTGKKRQIPEAAVQFLRREQMERVREFLRGGSREVSGGAG